MVCSNADVTLQSHVLPLSVGNLNAKKFVPWKDYSENRLKSGLLQLSDSTQLLVDETVMTAGQLDATGAR